MRKPPSYSPDSLRVKDLLVIMKEKQRWTSKGLFSVLLTKYPAYDKDGLNHKMRQDLSYLTKIGKIIRKDKGVYSIGSS